MIEFTQMKKNTLRYFNLINKVWYFPLVLTLGLFLFTIFQINGSSMGIYHNILYNGQKDPNVILGSPRAIRSDEFVVNTQMSISQYNNHFKQLNPSVGNGENVSVILDAPYKDWSELFKPHNLPFFVLPFGMAFAMKWWLMAYFFLLSCYFFILIFLPKKYLLASLLSIAFFFSPFIQWWYQFLTLGSIYYSLFICILFVYLINSKNKLTTILTSIGIGYLLVCFALIFYPPFQIPCLFAVAIFCLGYLLQKFDFKQNKLLLKKLFYLFLSFLISLILVIGVFHVSIISQL